MSEDRMTFPDTWEEFEKEYGFTDTEEIYTNGSRLIQTFRVQQWLEHVQAVQYNEADELRDMLTNRLDYIAVLEAKCRDLTEKLHETELAVEHNRHLADEEQYKGELRYRDGVIYGLKYAIRCNGVSGGEVNQ